MALVTVTQGLWRVTLVERERGYGQRVVWTEYYDNLEEAETRAQAVTDYADPEDYYVGEVTRC
jgi:hypothetical protein